MHEIYAPCEVFAIGGASRFEVRLDVLPSSNQSNPLSGRRNMIVCQQWHVLRRIHRSDRPCGLHIVSLRTLKALAAAIWLHVTFYRVEGTCVAQAKVSRKSACTSHFTESKAQAKVSRNLVGGV